MTTEGKGWATAFSWNAGGWFGSQLGCTLWMLILGLVLFSQDSLAAWVCLAGFAIVNSWGLFLWRSRARMGAYAAIQGLLLAVSVVSAAVVVVVNLRGVAGPPAPGAWVSTYLPFGVIAVGPALMVWFYFLEQSAKRRRS